MSEFVRYIERREFEDGLPLRLQIGAVAVGDVCKLRFEERSIEGNIQCLEAAVTIDSKSEENGLVRLRYIHEALRNVVSHSGDEDFFNSESIAIKNNLRTYLSNEPDPRWDDSLSELAEIYSSIDTM